MSVVLAGVRPEELGELDRRRHRAAGLAVVLGVRRRRGQAVDRAVDAARRRPPAAATPSLLIDTLDGLPALTARKALGAARAITDGGSLTVIATASEPLGGETTVVVLDRALTSTGRFPALDLVASGTLRPELLVGEEGARTIAEARASALGAK